MAEEREKRDDIKAIEPAATASGPSATPGTEPLEQVETLRVRSKPRIYAILGALYIVLFIAALDQTIIATTIPTISASLHSASGYIWIGGAYVLANAASGPIWSKCSDIWGRKPALLIAVVLFSIASLIAALSVNMAMLIAARALQGIAGGGLMQLVTITVSDLFSMRERALYIGLMGVLWAIAGSAGPLVGGALTEYVSWRWCFYINLPVCGLAFGLLLLFLDVHNPRTKLREGVKAIDWFGTFSILAVVLLLLLGLDFGGAIFPWGSPKVICLIVFGTLMIVVFLFSQKRAKYPLMPLGVFNDWTNNATFIVGFVHSMVSSGLEFYLPLYFQSVKQASPIRSGILILPMMVTEAATDVAIGIIIHRTGRYREITWVGAVLMTLGTGLYVQWGTDTTVATIVGFQMINAVGVACLFQTPLLAIQNTVSQADTASATATLGFIRRLATTLSIVLGGVLFQNSMGTRQSTLAAAGLSKEFLDAFSGAQAAAHVEMTRFIQDDGQRHVVLDAFAGSMRNMFIMYTCISAVGMVASAFIKHQSMDKEHTETKTGLQNMTKREA